MAYISPCRLFVQFLLCLPIFWPLCCRGADLISAHSELSLVHWDQHGPTCDLLQSCLDPSSCPIFNETPPPTFEVVFNTTRGSFAIDVVTEWAPPYAARLWHLGRLRYFQGASFYRVLRRSDAEAFVAQFGYRGDPRVDRCWDARMTLNTTWSVHPPGNQRGYVAFAMGSENQTGRNPNCTSTSYCARGFSANLFVNLADNRRLDAPGFSVVGAVRGAAGMAVVDRLYAGYGECRELCPPAAADPFCVGRGRACAGVSVARLLARGAAYLRAEKPLLDRVLHVHAAPLPPD
jgi:cyclophilin family peptidyl-prolyl cis-trans isomerase